MTITRLLHYISFILICFSCSNNKESNPISQNDLSDSTPADMPIVSKVDSTSNAITETVTVLSVAEELIMPGDYQTTAMTVKTEKNDTLVFLDMFNFEKLVGQKIKIQYAMVPQVKILVCANCTSYNKPVSIIDITTKASEIRFSKMKLKEYQSDSFIVPASKFIMIKEDGNTEEYYSNEISIHDDTTNLASQFYNYGTTVLFAPELLNRAEIESLKAN